MGRPTLSATAPGALWRLAAVAVLAAAGLLLLPAPDALTPSPASGEPATGPRTRPSRGARGKAAARPASRPVAEKYPPPGLVEACEAKAAAVRAQHGVKAIVRTPFVVAGDVSESQLASYAQWSVVRPAEAMWTAYFDKKPAHPITIFLFAGGENYKQYARRDYPDGDEPYFGYYQPSDRRMVMNIQTGTGTLVHELTHALIVYDFPDVPTWFNEGLASLHEQCSVRQDTIIGLTNWRLPGLQAAIKDRTLRPLKDLVTNRDFYARRLQGNNYAQARYFVMYMQTRGLLRKFYQHFRAHHSGRDADVKAIEHVFGRPLAQIEPEFVAWVKTLKFVP
jgi:hypothetical protein